MGKSSTLSFDAVLQLLRRRNFATLSTVGEDGRPHAVGVIYGVAAGSSDLYVMTRRHLKKARDIAANPQVAVVVPLTRRLLWFLPPPCVQFHGKAEILDRTDTRGIATFRRFLLGRRILSMYAGLERRGDTRSCFIRIRPDPLLSTYMVGHSIWELSRRMEMGAEKVTVPAQAR